MLLTLFFVFCAGSTFSRSLRPSCSSPSKRVTVDFDVALIDSLSAQNQHHTIASTYGQASRVERRCRSPDQRGRCRIVSYRSLPASVTEMCSNRPAQIISRNRHEGENVKCLRICPRKSHCIWSFGSTMICQRDHSCLQQWGGVVVLNSYSDSINV